MTVLDVHTKLKDYNAVFSQSQSKGGCLVQSLGTVMRARGIDAVVGELCELRDYGAPTPVMAEVIGFSDGTHILAPLGDTTGLSEFTSVHPLGRSHTVAVGDFLLGSVLDGFGRPLMGEDVPADCEYRAVRQPPPSAIDRLPIHTQIETGVRCLDSLVACGQGQRLGIFAPAGCGKTTLLGQIARNAVCDVLVIALIGERGRELNEFLLRQLDARTLARTVVVVATSDRVAVERMRAADVATTIAAHFADQGLNVVMLFDSLTRYARALREVGLAAGEPAVRRGFPPSVFAALPKLVERSGVLENGFVTAFYTVLEEDTSGGDPISEEVRSLLDGHIVLSRKLADAGRFPAVDVLSSISRLMNEIVADDHRKNASHLRSLLDKYLNIELLIQVGEYQAGTDALADEAIAKHEQIEALLRQSSDDHAPLADVLAEMEALCQSH
jgi:ATP synthase in type III secretion protein N